MIFPISAALLDAIVLSVVAQEPEGTYGYKITQQVTHTLELSESTPVPGAAPVTEGPAAHGLRCAPSMAATVAIIRSPPPGGRSLPPTRRSGTATVLPLTHFQRGGMIYDPYCISCCAGAASGSLPEAERKDA